MLLTHCTYSLKINAQPCKPNPMCPNREKALQPPQMWAATNLRSLVAAHIAACSHSYLFSLSLSSTYIENINIAHAHRQRALSNHIHEGLCMCHIRFNLKRQKRTVSRNSDVQCVWLGGGPTKVYVRMHTQCDGACTHSYCA